MKLVWNVFNLLSYLNNINEAETRAELIDPKLKSCGWSMVEDSKTLRERSVCRITGGRIQGWRWQKKPLIADYILVYKGIKLAVVEAKSDELEVGEGVSTSQILCSESQYIVIYTF